MFQNVNDSNCVMSLSPRLSVLIVIEIFIYIQSEVRGAGQRPIINNFQTMRSIKEKGIKGEDQKHMGEKCVKGCENIRARRERGW